MNRVINTEISTIYVNYIKRLLVTFLMKIFFVSFLFSAMCFAQSITNSIGGLYGSQARASVARDNTVTSIETNPAGLANIEAESISSGSSSYSLMNSSGGEFSYQSLASSSNHVATVLSSEVFNYGFMIHNSATTNISNEKSEDINLASSSPGFSDQRSSSFGNSYSYLFALAPKDSNYGFSFEIRNSSFKADTTNSFYTYSESSPDARVNNMLNFGYNFNIFDFKLNFGYQKKYNDYRYGLKLESPGYIIKTENKLNYNFMMISPDGANDVYVTTIRENTLLKPKEKVSGPLELDLGIAKIYTLWEIEANIKFRSSYRSIDYTNDKKGFSSLWISQSDTETQNNSDDVFYLESGYQKANYSLSLGALQHKNKNLKFGYGVSYSPTYLKNYLGQNVLTITSGISKGYKNFWGHYSIGYVKGFDAGGNENSNGESIQVTFEQYSFIFSGSYLF